jgi:hypothetical protein
MADDSTSNIVLDHQRDLCDSTGNHRHDKIRGLIRCSKRPRMSDLWKKVPNDTIFSAWQQSDASPFVRHYASREARRARPEPTPPPASSNQDWFAEDHEKALQQIIKEKSDLIKQLERSEREIADLKNATEPTCRKLQETREGAELQKEELRKEKERCAQYTTLIKQMEDAETSMKLTIRDLKAKHAGSESVIAECQKEVDELKSTRDKLNAHLSEFRDGDKKNTSTISSLKDEVRVLQDKLEISLRQYNTLQIDTSSAFETNEHARKLFREEVERAIQFRLLEDFAAEKEKLMEESKSLQDKLTESYTAEQEKLTAKITSLNSKLENERLRGSRLGQDLHDERKRIEELIQAKKQARRDGERLTERNQILTAENEQLKEEAKPREVRAQQRDTYQKYHEIWDEFKRTASMVESNNPDTKDFSGYWSFAKKSYETQPTLSRFREHYAELDRAILDHLTMRFEAAKAVSITVKGLTDELKDVRNDLFAVGHHSRGLTRQLHHDEPHLYELMRRNLDLLIEAPLQRLLMRIECDTKLTNAKRIPYMRALRDFEAVYRSLREFFLLQILQQASDHDKAVFLISKTGSDVLGRRVNQEMSKERWKLMQADKDLRAQRSTRFVLEQECGLLDADAMQKLSKDVEKQIEDEQLHYERVLSSKGWRPQDMLTAPTSAARSSRPVIRVPRRDHLIETRRHQGVGTVAISAARSSRSVAQDTLEAGQVLKQPHKPQDHSSAANIRIAIGKFTRQQRRSAKRAAKEKAAQATANQSSQSKPAVQATRLPGTVADATSRTETSDSNAAAQSNTGAGIGATLRLRKPAFRATRLSGALADATPSTAASSSDGNAAAQGNTSTGLGATPQFRKPAFHATKGPWNASPGIVRGFSSHASLSAADAQFTNRAPSEYGDEALGRKDLSTVVPHREFENGIMIAAASAGQAPRPIFEPCINLECKMNPPEETDSEQSANKASSTLVPEDGQSKADAVSGGLESPLELTYQIPASTFSQAIASSGTVSPLFWTHKLYKNPKGQSPVVFYCTSYETCERQAKLFLAEPVVGFDLEWETFASVKKHGPKQNVSLIQIASESQIGLFHVACFKGNTTEELMPPSLRTLLQSKSIIKAGVNIVGDANRMRNFFDVEMQGLMELSHIYRLVKYANQESHLVNFKLCGLAMQVQDILTLPLKKDETRVSRWSSKLNAQQTEYAAADAYAGFHLYHALERLRLLMDPKPPRPAFYETFSPLVLPDGTKVFRSEKRATTSVKKMPQAVTIDEASESEEFFDALETKDADEADGMLSAAVDSSDAGLSDSSEIVYPILPIEHLAKSSEEEGDVEWTRASKVLPLRPKAGVALPSNPETMSADSWAHSFLATGASSNRKKGSKARPQRSVNASTLRAYHLWHEQKFDIGRVAELCRQPPLALTTVATYVMTAIKEENLPFDVERARDVLKALPSSIKYRYASFVEAKRVT